MTIPEDVISVLAHWVFVELFYFLVILPTTIDGGWKNYDWKTFIWLSIISSSMILLMYILGNFT